MPHSLGLLKVGQCPLTVQWFDTAGTSIQPEVQSTDKSQKCIMQNKFVLASFLIAMLGSLIHNIYPQATSTVAFQLLTLFSLKNYPLFNTIQHNSTQLNSIQHNSNQFNPIQPNSTQFNPIHFNPIQHNSKLPKLELITKVKQPCNRLK